MKINLQPIEIFFLSLSVLILSCGPLTDVVLTPSNPDLPPEAQSTESLPATITSPLATITSLPEAAVSGDVLLQDDFSDTASGWLETSMPEGTMGYLDGGYHIYVNEFSSTVISFPDPFSYADVRVEVDAKKIGGDDESSFYGLICRYQDENNFYGASIISSSNGYAGFFGVADGKLHYFGMPGLSSGSVGINTGDASNHIRLDCIENWLSLYVNGELLDEQFTDSMMVNADVITSGDVGLYVHLRTPTEADILFDNFVVTQP